MDAGLERSRLLFINKMITSKFCQRTIRSRVALRKAGQVELLGRRLNNLARVDLARPTEPMSMLFFRKRKSATPQALRCERVALRSFMNEKCQNRKSTKTPLERTRSLGAPLPIRITTLV